MDIKRRDYKTELAELDEKFASYTTIGYFGIVLELLDMAFPKGLNPTPGDIDGAKNFVKIFFETHASEIQDWGGIANNAVQQRAKATAQMFAQAAEMSEQKDAFDIYLEPLYENRYQDSYRFEVLKAFIFEMIRMNLNIPPYALAILDGTDKPPRVHGALPYKHDIRNFFVCVALHVLVSDFKLSLTKGKDVNARIRRKKDTPPSACEIVSNALINENISPDAVHHILTNSYPIFDQHMPPRNNRRKKKQDNTQI